MSTESYIDRLKGSPTALTAVVVGGVLVLIGVLAPLVAGPEGEFIIFGRNYLHDVVHVGTGALGVAAGLYAGGRYARLYVLAVGTVYLAVAIAGIVFFAPLADLIALNTADNALHLLLAMVLLGIGLIFHEEGSLD